MYSQIRIKRHDEVVHDVEEVWRSLRRALLFLRSNEREQAAAALRFTVGVFNFVDDMDLITKYHLQILFAEMYLILRDEVESGRMYKLSYSSLVKKYGGEHLAVGDYCIMMSAVLSKMGKLEEAIEFSGRALVIRMSNLGLLHDKVADCHYNLGLLYRLHGDLHSSLKHLKICRGIKRNLFLDVSSEVAMVDMSIGHTEQWMVMYDRAYLSFYNAYRTNCILHGVTSEESALVLTYLKRLRYSHGTRLMSLAEIRDIIAALEFEYDSTQKLSDDPFLKELVYKLERGDKLVFSVLELKYIIDNVISGETFDATISKFIEAVGGDGMPDAELSETLFLELLKELSEESLAIVFEKEWRSVEAQRIALSEKLQNALRGSVVKDEMEVPISLTETPRSVDSIDACNSTTEVTTASPVAKDVSPALKGVRTRSVHFSPEHNIVHLVPQHNKKFEQDQSVNVHDIASLTCNFSDTIDTSRNPGLGPNENDAYYPNLNDNFSTSGKSAGKPRGNFFLRAAQTTVNEKISIPVINEEPDLPPPPDDYDLNTESPPPPSPETDMFENPNGRDLGPPRIDLEPPRMDCNFRLGSRSLLILHDADGKGVAIRPVTEQDVLSALKTRIFAFSGFLYLLQNREKQSSLSLDPGPVAARDSSKPEVPIPHPPPLPVGWPPRAPDFVEERLQTSLSALFKGASPLPSSNRKRSSATPILKLKQVHWDMVMLPSVEGTIWDTGAPEAPDDLSVIDQSTMFPDLIEEFEVAKAGALSKIAASPSVTSAKKSVPKNLIDSKRSQNMTIMLSKFGRTPIDAIGKAVLYLDTQALELSIVQIMLDQVPTMDEQRAVKQYFESNGQDETKLDKAEKFVLAMSRVALVQPRLSLLQVLLSIEDVQKSVERDASYILATTSEIQGSAKYKRLLHVILRVGNLLNKGSKKSSAVGFRLSSLPKFMQTKSNTGVSLIDYVVGHLLKQEPAVLDLSSDFTCLQAAKQTSFVSMSAEIAKLSVGISIGTRILEGIDKSDPDMDVVIKKIEDGVEKINKIVKSLETLCEEAVQRFNNTCSFLGEVVSDPETLFGQLISFLACIEKSSKDLQVKINRAAVNTINVPNNNTVGTSLKSIFNQAP